MELSTAFIVSRAIYAVAKLAVADVLDGHVKSAVELANLLGIDSDALFRIMRLLTKVGLFDQNEENQFSLTALGEPLLTGSPQSMRDYIILYHEIQYPTFTNLMFRLHEGSSAHFKTFDRSVFELVESNEEFASMFFAGLRSRAKIDITAIISAYDFSNARLTVDVGGGNGGLLSALLSRYPRMSGILFDLEPAIATARAGHGGPLPRCELMVGDFFNRVPEGADTYLLKLILHDWDDRNSVRILKNCREAMKHDGRLLIMEGLVGPSDTLTMTDVVDLAMLANLSGRERTESEFATMLESAAFRLERILPTNGTLFILEAVPK
jgi:SAM-dependent methyltransferase